MLPAKPAEKLSAIPPMSPSPPKVHEAVPADPVAEYGGIVISWVNACGYPVL